MNEISIALSLAHFYVDCFFFGKIANLVPLVVSNFDFGPPLKLFTHFVLIFYPITQSWSLSPNLDVDCYKGMSTATCHILIGL